VRPRELCRLPGCQRPVHIDLDGVPYQFCGRSHGQEFARRTSGGAASAGAEVVHEVGANVPREFQTGSFLVCVRDGCFNTVQAPHAGVLQGRKGDGPTRYNFCSRYCKIQYGVGEGTIPFSTTAPLARAWYRGLVESAQQEVRGVGDEGLEVDEEAGEPGLGRSSGGASPVEQPAPLVVADLSEEVVRSVMRCQGLMRKQMAKRAAPYQAEYDGRRNCPICHQRFLRGHGMVKCYVDPNPDCTWVHVSCAQAIVSSRGGRALHPTLQ